MTRAIALAAFAAIAVATFEAAQADRRDQTAIVANEARVSNQRLYQEGWRGRTLLETTVVGHAGERIGEVHDIVVGDDRHIRKIIIEGGGFLDIGDTHFAVPWTEVSLTGGGDRLAVPADADQLERYNRFGENDFVRTPDGWRVGRFIGAPVLLQSGERYGTIGDVIFGDGALVLALIIQPGLGAPGPYAVAYRPEWIDRSQAAYRLPYSSAELAALPQFDYARMRPSTIARID